jgi:hypothetical protein
MSSFLVPVVFSNSLVPAFMSTDGWSLSVLLSVSKLTKEDQKRKIDAAVGAQLCDF